MSSSLDEIVPHVSQLSSINEVVRLRLPVRVALADNQTRGDFMTKLHSFYLETRAKVTGTRARWKDAASSSFLGCMFRAGSRKDEYQARRCNYIGSGACVRSHANLSVDSMLFVSTMHEIYPQVAMSPPIRTIHTTV